MGAAMSESSETAARIYLRDGDKAKVLTRLPGGGYGNPTRIDLPGRVRLRSTGPATVPIPRTALTREEAAASLGMSLDSFERYVQPTIRLVRLGRMRLVPVSELERWLADHAAEVFD